ncbi:MAG: hypothetical protein AAF141_07120, partial [Pseudomonadota bacterium]
GQLFTQLLMIIVAAVIGGIALGTRTLHGGQFFRPVQGGTASTRGTAIACLTGLGLLPVVLPSVWSGDPGYGLALAFAIVTGGLFFVGFVAPALDRTDTPDVARLAVPDGAHSALRAAIYVISLGTLLAALAAICAYLFSFEARQNLIPGNFIARGAFGLALVVALLGGRAGIVRLAALALPLGIAAGMGVAIVGAGLELTTLGDISQSGLFRAQESVDLAIDLQTGLGLMGWTLISGTALGIVLGNAGRDNGGDVVRTPLTFFIGVAGSLLVIATISAVTPADMAATPYLVYALARDLELPIIFRAAAAASLAAMLCAGIAALLFACASVTLRGIAPILTQRRQPDGRQLFRARLLILALGAAMLVFAPTLDATTYGRAALLGGGVLTIMSLPILIARSVGWAVSNGSIVLSWLCSLTAMGTAGYVTTYALGATISALTAEPEAITGATAIGVLAGTLVILTSEFVRRSQLRKRATI